MDEESKKIEKKIYDQEYYKKIKIRYMLDLLNIEKKIKKNLMKDKKNIFQNTKKKLKTV